MRDAMGELVLRPLALDDFDSKFLCMLPAFLIQREVAVSKSDLRGESSGELFVFIVETLGTELVREVDLPGQRGCRARRDGHREKRRDRRMERRET